MIIAISSDHAGFDLRKQITEHLTARGHEVIESGAQNGVDAASYVSAGQKAAFEVLQKKADRGIVICGTGIGISIVCNKHKGIRCAVCTDEFMARMSREHNNANVLALGARVVGAGLAKSIVDAFMMTEFESGGRHQARVEEIQAQDEQVFSC